jgi:hypothetical protein
MPRPKSGKQPARLTVTLDEQDYNEICAQAERNDVSAAWVIRRAVKDFLGRPAAMAAAAKPARRMESSK